MYKVKYYVLDKISDHLYQQSFDTYIGAESFIEYIASEECTSIDYFIIIPKIIKA